MVQGEAVIVQRIGGVPRYPGLQPHPTAGTNSLLEAKYSHFDDAVSGNKLQI